MGEADFMPVRALPELGIPEAGIEEFGGRLKFKIETPQGPIDVEGFAGSAKWHCMGRAEALRAAGLIDMAWLPGKSGNAKVCQTVIFADGGAAICGRKPKMYAGSYLSILRVPGGRFEVQIPASPAQAVRLEEVLKRWNRVHAMREARQTAAVVARRAAEAAVATNRTPTEARDYIHSLINGLAGLADSYVRCAGLRLDPASARIFDQHIVILHGVIQNAVIERVPGEFTGNVVPFGPRR